MNINSWSRNDPEPYQPWQDIHYGHTYENSYIKFHSSAYGEKYLLKKHDMFSVITRFFKHTHCSPCDYSFIFNFCHNKENNYKLNIYIEHLTTKIQPVLNEHCTMLLIPNLAQLQWVSVNCTEKLINHVICFKGFKSENISMNTTVSTQYCGKNGLLFENIRYLILSFTKHQL